MLPHPVDIVALVLGVLFGLRQMDVVQRAAEQYPSIAPADFERWKRMALRAYRVGSTACFGKVLLDILFAYLFSHYPFPTALRWGIGLSLDVGWVVLVLTAWLKSRAAHRLARELSLGPPVAKPG